MSTHTETKKVFVCGAGHQGLSMAAHLALNGIEVNLWNRTATHIDSIIKDGIIHCTGIINGDAKLSRVSSKLADVVSDFVMVTTPSSAHRDIAKKLAPFVHPDMIIILNPGRTFGTVEFAEELKENGAKCLPHLAETQTIIYTCRKCTQDSVTIYALKKDVEIAAIRDSSLDFIISRMPSCLKKYFRMENSIAKTSLSNVGMVLHCAPVLMNIGWIESDKVDFKYYYDGISPSIAHFLEKIDYERQLVARMAGFEIESVMDWLTRTYGVQGSCLYECIRNTEAYKEIDAPPTLNTRYIFEDVPNGLVPIEFLGENLGIQTPNITTIINLACSVLDFDYRRNGRRFSFEKIQQYI